MNPKMIDFLYKGSIVMVVVAILVTIIEATSVYDFGDLDVMQLVWLSAVLWFVVWQLKRHG